jgi:hypothetical protein
VRRIFVLSAVFLMVLAAGPAAWADTSRRRGISARRSAGRGTTRRRPTSRAFVGEWHRAGGSSRESPDRRRHHEHLTSSPNGCLGQAPGPMRMLQPARGRLLPVLCREDATPPRLLLVQRRGVALRGPQHDLHGRAGWVLGAMLDWLKADLAANKLGCTVVIGHSPYLSSAAPSYGTPELSAIWPTLVLNDVDLFLAGHSHAYERLARARTQGNVDEDGHAGVPIGIAGTGGHSLMPAWARRTAGSRSGRRRRRRRGPGKAGGLP